MKKILFALVCAATSASAVASTSPPAPTCGELSAYSVQRASFDRVPVREALERIIRGTPYRLLVSSALDNVVVTAKSVSGRLDGVLADLIGQISQHHHVSWSAEKCALVVDSQGPKRAVETWNVTAGKGLRATLDEWASRAGWQPVSWELGEDLILGADARFEGDLIKAADALVEALGISRDVKIEAYEGNRVMRVVARKRGGN